MEKLPIFEKFSKDLKVFIESLLLIYYIAITKYYFLLNLMCYKVLYLLGLSVKWQKLILNKCIASKKKRRNHIQSNCSGGKWCIQVHLASITAGRIGIENRDWDASWAAHYLYHSAWATIQLPDNVHSAPSPSTHGRPELHSQLPASWHGPSYWAFREWNECEHSLMLSLSCFLAIFLLLSLKRKGASIFKE